MNGKIRLAALLTALLMLFQTIALAEVVTTVDDYNALLESRIEQFVKGTPEVQYAILMALETDEQRGSMLALLSEDQCIALSNYIMSLDPLVYKTVNFTHAGPFMPPVDVSGIARMRLMRTTVYSNDNTDVDNEAVYTSKVVSGNPKDGYKLRLETYVTGQTIVDKIEKSIPVDIVLVLDQSGSMAYDFSGNETNTNANRRQYAMKNAVTNFISSVAEKYNADDSDHRIAIVTFASSASKLQDWTNVDAVGSNTLVGEIKGLPDIPNGATNVAAGMSQASTLLGKGYSYTGQNTQRQKVVIVFTEGGPTTNTDFNTGVADNAIATAKNLKDERVTVYSIGIFNGAIPEQLYGEKWDYTLSSDILCDGSVGSYWGGSWLTEIVGSNDFDGIDIAAGNRFLNYLSSNTPNATNVGLERGRFNPGEHLGAGGTGYKITANFNKESNNYYLTADNADSLNNIFQTISDNIQTGHSSIALGTETVVKDIVADSFQLPENADTNGIKVYTSNYTVDKTWTAEKAVSLTVNVEGSTVSVTGFDFAKNYVNVDAQNGRDENDPSKTGNFYGRKLIIEIPIQVREGFLGGNNVPTNGANSGVYASSDAATPIETFTSPEVNVPIADIAVTAPDKNVYLLGGVYSGDMLDGASITCGGVAIDPSPTATNYGLKDWQNAYVDINIITSNALSGMTEDGTYTVTCKIKPTSDGTDANGTAATEKMGNDSGSVNVFKPEVTYQDSKVKYLDTISDLDAYHEGANLVSIAWKHETAVNVTDATDTTMIGKAPVLDYSYEYSPALVKGTQVTSTTDVAVNVTFAIKETPVTNYTTTVRQACSLENVDCNQTTATSGPAGAHTPEFVVHVYDVLTTLTITKDGMQDPLDNGQSFLFRVTGDNLPPDGLLIAINENGSETISGLLVGEKYMVTEVTDWSWRYTAEPVTSRELVADGQQNSVIVKNSRVKDKWLDGDCYAENVFNTQGNVQGE